MVVALTGPFSTYKRGASDEQGDSERQEPRWCLTMFFGAHRGQYEAA